MVKDNSFTPKADKGRDFGTEYKRWYRAYINKILPNELELQDTVWDDIRTPANNVKLDSVKTPNEVSYKGGLVLSFLHNTNNKIYFNIQVPHNYKLGTNLEFHNHIVLPATGTGNVKFIFSYSWAKVGGEFSEETTVNATRDISDDPADTHLVMPIAPDMDGSGIDGVSSMLLCSLERDVSVDDNYANGVYLLEVDFHYQIDTMGSRQTYTK